MVAQRLPESAVAIPTPAPALPITDSGSADVSAESNAKLAAENAIMLAQHNLNSIDTTSTGTLFAGGNSIVINGSLQEYTENTGKSFYI